MKDASPRAQLPPPISTILDTPPREPVNERLPVSPLVEARVYAHRYGISWERVREFARDLEDRRPSPDIEHARFAFDRCESPIEELFLAYMADCWNQGSPWCFWWNTGTFEEAAILREKYVVGTFTHADHGTVIVMTQVPWKPRRHDLVLMSHKTKKLLCVELDGHDFHERSKAQAAKDKSADRILQRAGFPVFRFTGSEVWRDAAACVAEMLSFYERGAS